MTPAHPLVISNLREITGYVRPMALANAIHARVPSSWGGPFFITLNNIRDCIDAGDRWFEEEIPEGFRVSTDTGFSCIVRECLACWSAPRAVAALVTGPEDRDSVSNKQRAHDGVQSTRLHRSRASGVGGSLPRLRQIYRSMVRQAERPPCQRSAPQPSHGSGSRVDRPAWRNRCYKPDGRWLDDLAIGFAHGAMPSPFPSPSLCRMTTEEPKA